MNGPICKTIGGIVIKPHPTLGILVRADGAVFMRSRCGGHERHWTFGADDGHGYKQFMIDGVKYKAHRLVAETFLTNPDNKPTVDHINGNRSDNHVENLRWATMRDQAANSASSNSSLKVSRPEYKIYTTDEQKHKQAERRKIRRAWIKSHKDQTRKFHNGVVAMRIYFGTRKNRILKWVPIELAAKLAEIKPKDRIYQEWMHPLSGRWYDQDKAYREERDRKNARARERKLEVKKCLNPNRHFS